MLGYFLYISLVCVFLSTDMYAKGSPKYNLMQKAALGVKKNSPKNQKKRSPKGSSMSYY